MQDVEFQSNTLNNSYSELDSLKGKVQLHDVILVVTDVHGPLYLQKSLHKLCGDI